MNEQMQTLCDMLRQSEWRSHEEIWAKQANHFHALMTHARQTVPFYSQYPENEMHDCPVLTRDQIQAAKDNMISLHIPAAHGNLYTQYTSGSTGKVVKVIGTDFTRLFYNALMLREHAWHQRDLMKKLFSIRWDHNVQDSASGIIQDNWGPPINQYKQTGPSIFMHVAHPTQRQMDMILLHQPAYILSYPSQLAALAEECLAQNIGFPSLEEVRTTGESFSDHYIEMIKKAWPQVKITDIYSSVEIGFIAQQCREMGNYHVNAENVLLEIVDDNNQPCAVGQPGRVLVTSLLNYATPFIRYEIGDYAEWSEPCACGRGLPVIRKIFGRKRNRMILPNGESRFPYLGEREDLHRITRAIKKFQIVQRTVTDIEIRFVTSEVLTMEIEDVIRKLMQKNFGYPFDIVFSYPHEICAGPTGKFEEFVSMVSA